MKRNLLIFVSTILLISCQKKEEIIPKKEEKPKEETFTAKYFFINQGDTNVRHVSLSTATVYPKSSEVCQFDEAYSNVGANDTLVKAIQGPYSLPAYVGCTTFMKVVVIFKEPVTSKFPDYNSTNGSSYKMIFISKKDTIRRAADATVTFKWPADTLLFEQVLY